MQVDPIKPTLKAPRTKRLELKYDKPLSTSAFKFNSRRYIQDMEAMFKRADENEDGSLSYEVGRCRLTVSKYVLKAPMV